MATTMHSPNNNIDSNFIPLSDLVGLVNDSGEDFIDLLDKDIQDLVRARATTDATTDAINKKREWETDNCMHGIFNNSEFGITSAQTVLPTTNDSLKEQVVEVIAVPVLSSNVDGATVDVTFDMHGNQINSWHNDKSKVHKKCSRSRSPTDSIETKSNKSETKAKSKRTAYTKEQEDFLSQKVNNNNSQFVYKKEWVVEFNEKFGTNYERSAIRSKLIRMFPEAATRELVAKKQKTSHPISDVTSSSSSTSIYSHLSNDIPLPMPLDVEPLVAIN